MDVNKFILALILPILLWPRLLEELKKADY